ncbi:MAG: hypothetical protein ACK4R2_00745 [Roseateles sp.]
MATDNLGVRLHDVATQSFSGVIQGNTQVFVYDLLSGSFLQMTDTPGAFSGDAVISADGLTLPYVSNMNLNGANRFGALQVFMDVLARRLSRASAAPA